MQINDPNNLYIPLQEEVIADRCQRVLDILCLLPRVRFRVADGSVPEDINAGFEAKCVHLLADIGAAVLSEHLVSNASAFVAQYGAETHLKIQGYARIPEHLRDMIPHLPSYDEGTLRENGMEHGDEQGAAAVISMIGEILTKFGDATEETFDPAFEALEQRGEEMDKRERFDD